MFFTGNQLLTDAAFYYQLKYSGLISLGKHCSWYMKGFFYNYIYCFSIKSVLTLPMLSRPVKVYRKLKTPVVEGCQKLNLIHHGLNCPGRCHRNKISLKRKVFCTGKFDRSTTCCNASILQSILSAQLLRHRIACGRPYTDNRVSLQECLPT